MIVTGREGSSTRSCPGTPWICLLPCSDNNDTAEHILYGADNRTIGISAHRPWVIAT